VSRNASAIAYVVLATCSHHLRGLLHSWSHANWCLFVWRNSKD